MTDSRGKNTLSGNSSESIAFRDVVAVNLRALCLRDGLIRKDLAKATGVTFDRVEKIAAGLVTINGLEAVVLARHFGVTVDALFSPRLGQRRDVA